MQFVAVVAGEDTFEGWHDGYMRLDDPVKHRRLVALDKAARRIVIEDTLEMGEEHDVELFFHFSEHCRVEAAGERFIASQDGQEIQISLPRAEGSSARVAGKSRTAARLALARLRCARRGAGHRLAGAALRAGPALAARLPSRNPTEA